MVASRLFGPVLIVGSTALFGVLIVSLLFSIDRGDVRSTEMNYRLDETKASFINKDGQTDELILEIADTAERRRIGLMNRLDLHYDEGMIFIYDEEVDHGFWMRNTYIYLDMIFVDATKTVVDVIHFAQPCRVTDCPSYQSDKSFRYVVEVNGGWTNENDVGVGSVLMLD